MTSDTNCSTPEAAPRKQRPGNELRAMANECERTAIEWCGYDDMAESLLARATELRAAADQAKDEPSGWWCPHCQKEVPGVEVTFSEHHEACGYAVGEKPKDEPVACFGYGIQYPSDDDGDLLKDFSVHRDVAKGLTERHGGTFFQLYTRPDPRVAELEGLLLWALYHAQGGSSPVGQPIRRYFGIGQHERMTDEQIARARAAALGDGK